MMKKTTCFSLKNGISVLFMLTLGSFSGFAQTTETFETETDNATTFTDNGQSFTINNLMHIENATGFGVGGTDQYIDISNEIGVSVTNPISDGGTPFSGSFETTDGRAMLVTSLYLFVSDNGGGNRTDAESVDVIGRLGGVPQFTQTIPFGAGNWPDSDNGFTLVTLSGANQLIEIDEILISPQASQGVNDEINYIAIDEFTWDYACVAPTAQATTAVFGTETSATLDLTSWTAPAGGATGYVVFIDDDNASFSAPTQGTSPTASTAYVGTSPQVIYNGTSPTANVTVTGLNASTTYHFQIYSYNDCSSIEVYEATGLSASDVTAAACAAPTAQATSPSLGTANAYNLTLNSWTAPAGGATGYVVFINDDNVSFSAPSDGTSPTAGSGWLGSGPQVIYNGTSVSANVTVTNLTPSTTYYYQIYSYNDCAGTETYETTGLNTMQATVAAQTPTCTIAHVTSTTTLTFNEFGQSFTTTCGGLLSTITTDHVSIAGDGASNTATVSVYSGESFPGAAIGSISNVTLTAGGPQVFDFSSSGINLSAATQYTFIIDNTADGDAVEWRVTNADEYAGGRTWAAGGFANSRDLDFSVEIVSPPTFTTTWLDDGDGTIDQVRLDFSENVTFTDGNGAGDTFDGISISGGITLTGSAANQINFSTLTGVSTYTFDITGATGTADPGVDVTYNSTANYTITGDVSGLPMSNGDTETSSIDGANPVLLAASSTPLDNATGVNLNTNVVLTFSENVQAGTGNISIIDVVGADDRVITIPDAQLVFSTNTVTINPSTDLLTENNNYAVNVDATAIDDQASPVNSYAGIGDNTTMDFTTNNSPVTTFPGTQSSNGIASVTFTGGTLISIADADTDNQSVTVSVVNNGDFTTSTGALTAIASGGAIVGGNASATLTISGTLADVNGTLDGMTYLPGAIAGQHEITIDTDDGNGGTDSDIVLVNVSGTYTLTVTTDNVGTPPAGSLRAAMLDANLATGSADIIDASGLGVSQTITLVGNLPAITDDLTINGPGASDLNIDGVDTYSIFENLTDDNLTITALTLSNGLAATNGGAIYHTSSGTLTVTGVHFNSNSTSAGDGGAISSTSNTNISQCLFTGNSSSASGGAILTTVGTLNVDNSTFNGNSATTSGGAVRAPAGTANFDHVTISNNSAGSTGDGIESGAATTFNYSIAHGNGTNDVNVTGGTFDAESTANIIGTSTGTVTNNTNVTDGSTDFTLTAIADNGGETQTMYVSGSEAVAAAAGSTETVDQIGNTRDGNPYNDLGALEVAPEILNAYFFDVNPVDGVIDEVVIELTEEVEENTSAINTDFTISSGSLGTRVLSAGASNALDATDGDEFVTFPITGYGLGTSIATLTMSYSVGSLTNGAGAAVNANGSITLNDNAFPQFLSGLVADGNRDDVVVTFSENMTSTDESGFDIQVGGGGTTVNTFNVTNAVMTFTLSADVIGGQSVTIQYVAASGDAADVNTNALANFGPSAISNNVNNIPTFATLDDTPNFTEDGSAVVLDNDATLADVELDGLDDWTGASLTIVRNGGLSTNDVFGFQTVGALSLNGANIEESGNVVATFDQTTTPGQLIVTFVTNTDFVSANDADAILQNITYSNPNDNPPANVTLDFVVNDGTDNSATGNIVVSITANDDTPSFAGLNNNPAYTEDGTAQIFDNDATVSDPEFDFADDWTGGSISIIRNGGVSTNDVYGFQTVGLLTLNGTNIEENSNVVATFDQTSNAGELVITFVTNTDFVSAADADAILQNITYSNSNQNPPASVTMDFTVDDGNSNSGGSISVTLNSVNDAPTSSNNTVTAEEDVTFTFSNTDFAFTDATEGNGFQQVYIIALPATGALEYNGSPAVIGTGTSYTDRTLFTYDAVADENGTTYTTFTFQVVDDGGTAFSGVNNSATFTMTVDVDAINDEPTFVLAGNQAANSGDGLQTVPLFVDPSTDITFGPADESGQAVFDFIVVENSDPNNVITSIDIDNAGQLTYTPTNQTQGTATIDVQVTDNGGVSGTGADNTSPVVQFTITITDNEVPAIAAPTSTDFTPADNATGVAATNALQMVFDEDVNIGTGNITVFDASDDSQVAQVDVTDGTLVTESNGTVDIDLENNWLIRGNEYYVQVDNTAFVDLNQGLAYPGISNTSSWGFTMATAGSSTPNLLATIPADQQIDVLPTQPIILIFDEKMTEDGNGNDQIFIDIETDMAGSGVISNDVLRIDLGDNSDASMGLNSTVANSTNVVTIDFANTAFASVETGSLPFLFNENTVYSFQLDGNLFDDSGGNPAAAISKIYFTTVLDGTPPVLAGTSNPTDGATVPVATTSIDIDFTEAGTVQAVPAGGNIQLFADTNPDYAVLDIASDDPLVDYLSVPNTVSIDISGVTLAGGINYYVNIDNGAISDDTGNEFTGISDETTLNFDVAAETTPPVLTGLLPADNAATVAIGDNFVLTFDEPVFQGTGTVELKLAATNNTVQTLDASSITFSGNTATLNFTDDLDALTFYYITVPSGVIQDNGGTAYPGFTNTSTYNFISEAGTDVTGPVDVSTDPADLATGVLIGSDITITFSEAVEAQAGNFIDLDYSGTGPGVDRSIDVTNAIVTSNSVVIPVGSTLEMPTGNTVDVTINAGTFNDQTGNSNLISTFSFDTEADLTAPAITPNTPVDDATGVTVSNPVITIDFDENVNLTAAGGDVQILLASDLSVVGTLNTNTDAGSFTGGGTSTIVATFTGVTLEDETEYYVLVKAGAFEDTSPATNANDAFGGSSGDWSFTTVFDVTAPTLVITRGAVTNGDPDNGTNDTQVTYDLAFSEPITDGTFTVADITVNAVGVSHDALAGGDLVNSGDDQNYTLTIPNVALLALPDGTIDITVGPNIDDAALTPNAMAGAEGPSASFTIDQTAPLLEALTVASGTVPVDHATTTEVVTLTMDFDDDIPSDPIVAITSGGALINNPIVITETDAANDIWTAVYTVSALDSEGDNAFTVDFTDDAGNVGVQVDETDLTSGTTVENDNIAPTLTSVGLTTNNADNQRGAVGDVVTLAFTVDDDLLTTPVPGDLTIRSGGVLVAGPVAIGGSAPNFTAFYTVNAADTDGNVTFTIDFTDDAGNAGTQVTSVTDASSVEIDISQPGLTITRNTPVQGVVGGTNDNTVSFDLTFDEVIDDDAGGNTFTIADIAVNSTITSFTALTAGDLVNDGDDRNYTLTISGLAGTGTLGITVGPSIDDLTGNAMSAAEVGPLFTIDAPVLIQSSAVEDADITITAQMNETGTVYYTIQENGVGSAPSIVDVLAGDPGFGATVHASGTINISTADTDFDVVETLVANTTYDIYLVPEDDNLTTGILTTDAAVVTGGATITQRAWSNLCLDGPSEVSDVAAPFFIVEGIANDIKEGVDQTILIAAPTNFEFNTGVGSASQAAGTGLTNFSVTYLANNVLQVEFDASAASLSSSNTIAISDVEIQAITSVTAALNITRAGGTSDIFGANGFAVFGTAASKARPTAPTILESGTNDITNDGFGILAGKSISISAAGTSIDWYYFDGTLAEASTSVVTETELAGTVNGSVTSGFDENTENLYSFYATDTDIDGCVSDQSPFNIGVQTTNLSSGTTNFLDDDAIGKTISAVEPTGHTSTLSGAGLGNFTSGSNTVTADFIPTTAGGGTHSISLTFTNNNTGESLVESQDYIVAAAIPLLLTTSSTPLYHPLVGVETEITKEVCVNDAAVQFIATLSDVEAPNVFYRFLTASSGLSNTGFVAANPDNSTAIWQLDPATAGGDDAGQAHSIVRRVVDAASISPSTEDFNFLSDDITVFNRPLVNVSNLTANYCQDDSPVTVEADVSINGNIANNVTFASVTVEKNVAGFSTIGTLTEASAGVGVVLNFDDIVNNTGQWAADGLTASGAGEYRIRYVSDAADDPNNVGPGCQGQLNTFTFNVYAEPADPTLDLSGGGVDQGSSNYLFEYCVGTTVSDLIVNEGPETIRWYEDDGGGGLGTEITPGINADAVTMTPGSLFGTSTPAAGTYIFHFTQTDFDEVSGFDGCESGFSTVTFEIYSVPAVFDFDVTGVDGEEISTDHYAYEYCEGTTIAGIGNLIVDSPTISTGVDYYDWYASDGSTLIDGFETNAGADEDAAGVGSFTTAGNTIALASELFGTGTHFGGTTTPTAGTYTLFASKRENRNSGTTPDFNGCTSSLVQVDLVFYALPAAPTIINDFITDVNACAGDLDINPRIATTDELVSPQETDVQYNWYADPSKTNLIDIVDDSGGNPELTYAEVFANANVTAPSGTVADGLLYYTVSADFNETVHITQTTNRLNSLVTGFAGCESTAETDVDITIYPLYAEPGFTAPDPILSNGYVSALTADELNYYGDALTADSLFEVSSTYTETATNFQNFEWWFASAAFAKQSLITVADSSAANAEELILVKDRDATDEFILSQVTDIEIVASVTVFDGCESSPRNLRVNTFNLPDAPEEDRNDGGGSVTDFYYCEGTTVADVTVDGEDEDAGGTATGVPVTFYWYQTLADAENADISTRISHRLSTADATGKTILISELLPDENGGTDTDADGIPDIIDVDQTGGSDTDVDGIDDFADVDQTGGTDIDGDGVDDASDPVVNLSGSPGVGDYTFYVTQSTDIDGAATPAFGGSEGEALEITIHILDIPADPTLNDLAPTICDGDAIPQFSITNPAGGAYTWVFDANTNATNDDTPVEDETTNSSFTPTDPGVGTWNYFVSQTTDINVGSSGFAGCESNYSTIVLTENDIPAAPTVTGNSGANSYIYCADATISTLTISNAASYSSPTFNWYSNSGLTNSIITAESVDGTIISADDHPSFPAVTDATDVDIDYYVTTVEDGCESNHNATVSTNVTLSINRLPVVDILYGEAAGVNSAGADLDATQICYDEATFFIQGREDKDMTLGTFEDATSGVFTINTAGITDNTDGTADFDPATAALTSTTREGLPTDHIITFTYTDSESCVGTINKTVTVKPQPTLSITYDAGTGGNNAGDAVDGTEVCYDEAEFVIQGRQTSDSETSESDALSGTFVIYTTLGDANAETNPLSTTGFADLDGVNDGKATFDPAQIGTDDGMLREGVPNTYYLRFDYTDVNVCDNFVVHSITINPQPTLDIVYADDTSIDGTDLCYDNGSVVLTGIQEGIDALTSAGTISFSINTGGLTDNGDGTATFNPAVAAVAAGTDREGLPTDHDITFTFTDLNGCQNSVTHTVTVDPQPTLQIEYGTAAGGNTAGDGLDGTFVCYDEATFTIQGTHISDAATTESNATSGTFEIFTDAAGTTALVTTGLVDNTDGTASIDAAQIATDGGETREGAASTYYIKFTYDDVNGCQNTVIESLTIEAQPTLDITFNATTISGAAICYDNGFIIMQGVQEGASASSGSFSVNTGGLTDLGNGTASFDPIVAATAAGETREGLPSTHDITFNYTDGNSCSNSVTLTFTVNPQPTLDIVYADDTSIDGTALCYDNGTVTLTGVQEGIDALTSAGTISFSVNTGGLTDNGDGTATFNPATAAVAAGTDREGLPTDHDITFTFTDLNGCENSITSTITVKPQPTLQIEYGTAAGGNSVGDGLDGTFVCYDEATFTIQGTHISDAATTESNATSGTFEIFTDAAGTTALFTTGLVDNSDGTASIDAAQIATDGGETREGAASTYYIKFTYSDANGCQNTVIESLTIESQPTLDITFNATTISGASICYDNGFIIMQGVQEGASATSGTFSVNTGGLTDLGNGTASFDPIVAATAAGETREGLPSTHDITFNYTDGNSCSNSVTLTFTVNPQPTLDIVYADDTSIDGTDLCYDNGTVTLTGVQEGIDALTSAGTISFTVNTGGLTDNGDGTATFNPITAAVAAGTDREGLPTDHDITFTFTDLNGCENSITSTITVKPQPTLQIEYGTVAGGNSVGDGLDGTFVCYDEATFTIQGTHISDAATTESNATSGTFEIFTDAAGTTALVTTGLVDNSDGTATINATQVATDGGETREGAASTYYIKFTYADVNGCQNTVIESITIEAQPTLDITFGGSTINGAAICYDNGLIIMQGVSEGANVTSGTFTVNTGGLVDLGNGTASFDPEAAALAAGETREGLASTHNVSFNYTDGNACSNNISLTFTVNPQPTLDIHYDSDNVTGGNDISVSTTIDGTAVCYTDDPYALQGVQEGANAASGSWSISTGGLSSDSNDGTISLDPTLAAQADGAGVKTDPSTTHDITFDYTDLNGCQNDVTRTVTVNHVPLLSFTVQNSDVPSAPTSAEFCVDTTPVAVSANEDINLDGNFTPVTSGAFTLSGSIGITDNGDGTMDFLPDVAHPDATGGITVGGAQSSHVIVFAYTDANGCFNSDSTEVFVNPLPDLDITSTLSDFRFDDETAVEICANEGDFRLQGSNSGASVLTSQFTIINSVGGATDLPTTGNLQADFSPTAFASEIDGKSSDFTVSYLFNDFNGCSNTYTETITMDAVPDVTFNAEGGCESPDVQLDAVVAAPYTVNDSDLLFTWSFFNNSTNASDGFSNEISLLKRFQVPTGQQTERFRIELLAQATFPSGLVCQNVPSEVESSIEIIPIQITPSVAFTWDSVTVNTPVKFLLNETDLPNSDLKGAFVDFGDGLGFNTLDTLNIGDELFETDPADVNSTLEGVSMTYPSAGIYNVGFILLTNNDCLDTLFREVNVIPSVQVTPTNLYYQSFDVNDGFDSNMDGWYAETLSDNAIDIEEVETNGTDALKQQSWVWTNLKFGTGGIDFVTNDTEEPDSRLLDEDKWAWSTTGGTNQNIDGSLTAQDVYFNNEDSWMYSPSFDISALQKPMVRFNAIYDFASGEKDAVVMQYSIDDGERWIALGAFNDDGTTTGINWYNSNALNSVDPGQQTLAKNENTNTPVGWRSLDTDVPVWRSFKHKLDEIPQANRDAVRFRFSIGATDDSGGNEVPKQNKFGFGFDDFEIVEREKNVLLEMFSSTVNADSRTVSEAIFGTDDTVVDGVLDDPAVNNGDVLVINYHASFYNDGTNNDELNALNAADPSARASYYGVDQITSFLNGDVSVTTGQTSEAAIPWTPNDLSLSSLADPLFDISFSADAGDNGTIDYDVTFTAREFVGSDTTLLLFAAVVEDVVTGINGANGQVESRRVLRKLLSDGAGQLVSLTNNLNTGDVVTYLDDNDVTQNSLNALWDIKNVTDPDANQVIDSAQLFVVAFIQDRDNKTIYQSQTQAVDTKGVVTSLDDELSKDVNLKLYPNPADRHMTIVYPQRSTEDLSWAIFDQSGRVYKRGDTIKGFEGFEVDVNDFPEGIYYISVYGENTKYEYKKLMIIH